MGTRQRNDPRIAGLVAVLALFSLGTNALMLTGPLFMLQVYDRVLATRSEETLAALAILAGGLFALYGVLEFARARVTAGAVSRALAGFAGRLFRGALEAGDGRAPVALGAMREGAQPQVLLPWFDLPFVPLFLGAIFLFHPALGLLATGGAGTLAVLALVNRAASRRALADSAAGEARAERHWGAVLGDAGYVRAQGMGAALGARWLALLAGGLSRRHRGEGLAQGFSAAAKALRLALQSGILALGALMVLRGAMTPGAMIAASILFGRALQPVEQVISGWPVMQRTLEGWRQVRATASTGDESERTALPAPKGLLALQEVSVVPVPGAPPVLHGITLRIAPGEALGVIGKSGSGKTTLARVLVGALQPTLGEVRLDGSLLAHFRDEARGAAIGYLPQEERFFDGSVAENIARMGVDRDDAAVVAAAKQAGVHGVIQRLPEGYDTRLESGSPLLSGGARQRVGLARALFGEPPVLILDEPNAALDAEGQAALNAVIAAQKAAGGVTVVMTHRPGAIAACDRLVVLDDGRIRADGPRDRVLARVAANAQLIRASLGAVG